MSTYPPIKKIPRPTAKVRAGVWPSSPHGTTYIDVRDPSTGACCTIELQHAIGGGSLKVQMHKPQGAIHLCSPKQCVWSSANEMDQKELADLNYYRIHGRFPPTA